MIGKEGGYAVRQYECECLKCGNKRQYTFQAEPFPELDDVLTCFCVSCQAETDHKRTFTRKALAEQHRKQQEEELRESIAKKCDEYGFRYRFLYQSVIVTTNLSDWCFDYHESQITLYHESTIKINFETGNYAKAHVQFEKKKIKPTEVIDYIAGHDAWRTKEKTS